MSIDETTVKKIAKLARLRLDTTESQQLSHDLNQILELVGQMNDADTVSVSPLAHPHDSIQPLREDAITETNQRETYQALATKTELL